MEFEGKNVRLTQHVRNQIIAKGFDPEHVRQAIVSPDQTTDVLKHPGQIRNIAHGVAVVLAPNMRGTEWTAVTVYADGVLTPPRPDQMLTAEGRRYAARYAQGLGRG